MKCISVPVSQDAVQRLDFDESIDGDLFEVTLTDEQFNALFRTGVLSELNKLIEINIDEFEDEKIVGKRDLKIARRLLGQLSASDSVKVGVLLSQIDKAIEYDTGVYFYF